MTTKRANLNPIQHYKHQRITIRKIKTSSSSKKKIKIKNKIKRKHERRKTLFSFFSLNAKGARSAQRTWNVNVVVLPAIRQVEAQQTH